MTNYLFLVVAAASNVATVYFAKASQGMSRLWPAVWVVVTIVAAQWLLALAMRGGINVAVAATSVVAAVTVGSLCIGILYGEKTTLVQLAGVLVAVAGILLMNFGAGKA